MKVGFYLRPSSNTYTYLWSHGDYNYVNYLSMYLLFRLLLHECCTGVRPPSTDPF